MSTQTRRIRAAVESDVPAIREMIVELAVYEKEPDAVKVTETQLANSLFGANPEAYATVAEADGEVLGFAIWFLTYSTWEGVPGIYLEDLYVRPAARGLGFGKALIADLARIAVEREYARLEWRVLRWNRPSIDFYESLGAKSLSEWDTYRLTDVALQELGQSNVGIR